MMKKPMPKQIGIRLPAAELNRLRMIADAEGRTISGQIRFYVRRALEERQHEKEAVRA